jgi:hypothetical protein
MNGAPGDVIADNKLLSAHPTNDEMHEVKRRHSKELIRRYLFLALKCFLLNILELSTPLFEMFINQHNSHRLAKSYDN